MNSTGYGSPQNSQGKYSPSHFSKSSSIGSFRSLLSMSLRFSLLFSVLSMPSIKRRLKHWSWNWSGITLFEIFIFCPKIQLWFPDSRFYLGEKLVNNVMILYFLAVDNFDFTRKIVKKKFWVKNSWKYWGFVKIEFLDKNLTFWIVCNSTSSINVIKQKISTPPDYSQLYSIFHSVLKSFKNVSFSIFKPKINRNSNFKKYFF